MESMLYYHLLGLVENLKPELRERFCQQADAQSNYFKLFTQLEKSTPYETLRKESKNSIAFTKELNDLERTLVEKTRDRSGDSVLDALQEVEHLVELGLADKALAAADRLEQRLENQHYWIRWRLLEIRQQLVPLTEPNRKELYRMGHLHQLARWYVQSNLQAYTAPTDEEKEYAFYKFLSRYRTEALRADEKALELFEELEALDKKTVSLHFPKKGNIVSFEMEHHTAYLLLYFRKAFELMEYLHRNAAFLTEYQARRGDDLAGQISRKAQSFNPGASQLIPNALTLYNEYLLTNLQSALLFTNVELRSTEWGQGGDPGEINVEELATRIEVLKTVSRIFVYDPHLHNKAALDKIIRTWAEIKDLLNVKKHRYLTPENELGLKCLYVMLVRLLRESAKKVKAIETKYRKQILEPSGTEDRYAKVLKQSEVYHRALTFKGHMEYAEAKTFLQVAIIKLHNMTS